MRAFGETLVAPEAAEFGFELLDTVLGCEAGVFGLVESEEVALGNWVVPAQLGVLPADVESEDLAVAPEKGVPCLRDFDGLVRAVHQAVPGQTGVVSGAVGWVEAPVLWYSESGVVDPLYGVVVLGGGE